MLEIINQAPNPANITEHMPNTTVFTFCVHKRFDLNTTHEMKKSQPRSQSQCVTPITAIPGPPKSRALMIKAAPTVAHHMKK